MTFAEKQNEISKKKITLVILKLDFCSNVFGEAPCTATGQKCYNTYFTCKDKTNFVKTAKEYRYVNNDAPDSMIAELNALPYFQSMDHMSTELQDDKTITARINITMLDEIDYDQGIDPYWEDRRADLLTGQGTHWKKLIERNPFYRGRIIEVWEGYEGLAFADFKQRLSGKLKNITRDGGYVRLECADDIADLSAIKYPFKTNIKTAADLGACQIADSETAMLKLDVKINDYALRTDFKFLEVIFETNGPGSLDIDTYYYWVIAYNASGNPIGTSTDIVYNLTANNMTVKLVWSAVVGASSYRVYGRTSAGDVYAVTTNTYFNDDGSNLYVNSGYPADAAERYFIYNGPTPEDLSNWSEIYTNINLALEYAPEDASGYLMIDDEVLYYGSVVGTILQGLRRVQYKTKAETPHYSGTNIKYVLWYEPQNPFEILEDLLSKSGIPAARVDTDTIDTLKAVYSGIDFSTYPIIKETDAAKLVFDLCYALDIYLWVNEDGKITVKYKSDETVQYSITDANNIVLNSKTVDYASDEIKTRFLFYYDRIDPTKNEDSNFSNIHFEVNADAEGENMYNEELPETVQNTWINLNCDTQANITAYLKALLNKKAARSIYARPKVTFEVESKDSDIAVGDVVELSSNAFQDVDGYDYSERAAIIVSKELKESRVGLGCKLLPLDTVTTTTINVVQMVQTKIPVTELDKFEVSVLDLEYFNGSTWAYLTGHNVDDIENEVSLRWTNMYESTEDVILNVEGDYITILDLTSWKTVKHYVIYMFVANENEDYPLNPYPSATDSKGTWYIVGTVKDQKIADSNYKYEVKIKNVLPLGGIVSLWVSAKADLQYKDFITTLHNVV